MSWDTTYAAPTRGGLTRLISIVLRLLDGAGAWISALVLRLWLAWEFWESGVMKAQGMNWFADIQSSFPAPLNAVPVEISWAIATWFEVIGAIALVIGLGTRFWAASLTILTMVAWYAVHAGNGYNVCDNGWKLPLIYVVAFIPLLFSGAGKLSLDAWIRHKFST